ncbi:hypothetical protein [Nocardia flavorosea]|uniref:PPE family protein n=1 Tax=Nocardia flavorosea TaxID=53429 RepID=A0A846YEV2_9NOCA|nr:hypothetical protein [Nocardia flavorosea]NKY58146.1 hypothetical protein [Nocardia flavorosea]
MSTEWPVAKLATPSDDTDPVSNLAELMLNGNGVSMSYMINAVISYVTGFDPIGTVTNYASGDWSTLYQSAQAIRNMAGYNSAYEGSIDSAAAHFAASWTGNAADDARAFFTTLGDSLTGQIDPMNEMAGKIEEFALNSYEMANGIAAALQGLGDLAIVFLVNQAAARLPTPAAAVFQSVAAAIAAVMAVKSVQVVSAFGNWYSGAMALLSYLESGEDYKIDIPELPEKTYDHPGVS